MKKIFIIIGVALFFTSCIPTKDLTYFQGEPVNKNKIHQLQSKPYKLQINDIVDIKIKAADESLVSMFKVQENATNSNTVNASSLYFNSYSVDRKGMIRIPYLGELNVLGYSTKDVRVKIENELGKMFKNMNDVFVTVKLAGIRYTILGEIGSPGTKILYQNQVNIIEAIANSGDIVLTGDRKNIEILRTDIAGVTKYKLDLTGFDFMDSEAFFIQPNDIIYVKPLKEKSWGTGQTGTKTMSTIITALSLLTTSIILINRL